jgi:integrase
LARRTWTDKSIEGLKPRAKRYAEPDPKLAGHYVRVTPNSAKSFVAVARDPQGKQVWHTIGSTDLFKLDEARELAREAIKAIRVGGDRSGPQSFASVAEQWFKRHVEAKGLRSAKTLRAYLDQHILPAWGTRDFESIRRGDVATLLDRVEDTSGAVSADRALAVISGICNWYVARHEDYVSPVVRGMRRSNAKERARARILDDNEIRLIWRAAEANGTFGGFIRLLLLTAQRRDKIARLRWNDLTADGSWIIKTESREKGNAGELALPQIALDIISAQPRIAGNPYVFAGRGDLPIHPGKRKEDFAAKLPPMPNWTLHDLRRTARSLMSRAGIRPDVAERVLGHVMGGVEGVYDRHTYREEKAHALRMLAGLIGNIVRPEAAKVHRFRG